MRFLVAGAGGFIGSHVARRLLAAGEDVHCLFHRDASRLPPAGTHHRVDLGDAGALGRTLGRCAPEVVLNFAQVDPSAQRRGSYLVDGFTASIQGFVNLLTGCDALGVGRFVHACSSTVYADLGDRALREDGPFSVKSVRALTKLTERNLCLHQAACGAMTVVLGRVFRAYGAADKPDKLIARALAHQRRGSPVPLSASVSRRDYVYVEDVAEAFELLATRPLASGEEINIGTGRETSATAVLDALERITGSPIARAVGAFSRPPFDRAHWRADTRKAADLLGWRARTTLEEGLERTVARARGPAGAPAARGLE